MPRQQTTAVRRVLGAPLFHVLLVAIAALVGANVIADLPDGTYRVEVELSVSDGGTSELFVNAESGGPYRQAAVVPGRQTLVHDGVEGPFRTIRVDPVTAIGAEVTLHSIVVRDGDGAEVALFQGGDFEAWGVVNGADVRVAASGLSYVTTDADNSVSGAVDISSGGGRGPVLAALGRWLRSPVGTMGLALAAAIGCAVLWLLVRRRWTVTLVVVGPLAVYVGAQIAGSVFGVSPADQALGQSGFFGRDIAYPTRFLVGAAATVALVGVAGLAVGLLFGRWPGRATGDPGSTSVLQESGLGDEQLDHLEDVTLMEESVDAPPSVPPPVSRGVVARLRSSRSSGWWAVLAVPVVVALVRLPSAQAISDSLRAPLAYDWDQANLRTWDHFFARGLQPMVDFWYPYGNLIWLRTAVVGAVIEWWMEVLCFVLFSRALWQLARRRAPVVLGGIAVAVVYLQVYCGVRYLFPVAAVCWFASSRGGHRVERTMAALVIGGAPFVAVDVGLYALVGAVAAVAIEEIGDRSRFSRPRRRQLLIEAGLVAAGWVAFLVVGLVKGDATPTLSLVLDQRTTTAFAGAIQPISESIAPWPRPLLYVMPFALLGLTLWRTARRGADPVVRRLCGVLAGLGSIGTLVLAKQLVRPGIDGALLVLAVAAVAAALSVGWADGIVRRGCGVGFGLLLGLLWFQARDAGATVVWREAAVGSPRRGIELVGAFTWNRESTLLFRPTLDRPQLVNFPDEIAAADAARSISPTGRIFVLGDSQFIYPLTDAEPYWVTSMWELSPISEQRRLVELLEAAPPAVVVLDRLDRSFDGVPYLLRVPLAYRWVVEHYRVESTEGPYDLLVPRDGEPIDWAYWRDALGTTIDLGRLPAAATGDGERCLDVDVGCVVYLEVEMQPVEQPTQRTVEVSAVAGSFTLVMMQEPGDVRLMLPLGRLWFWQPDDSDALVTVDGATNETIFATRGAVLY